MSSSSNPMIPPPVPQRRGSIANEPIVLEETFYHILGIKPDASLEQIKEAYERLNLEVEKEAKEQEERLAQQPNQVRRVSAASKRGSLINKAYLVLSSPNFRERYDHNIQLAKQARVEFRLRWMQQIEPTKAFFEAKQEPASPKPEFVYLRMTIDLKNHLEALNQRALMYQDNSTILSLIHPQERFMQVLAERANKLLHSDLLSSNTSKNRDGVFATEKQASEQLNALVLHVKYKDPLNLEQDPIGVADIVSIRDSTRIVVYPNVFYEQVKLTNQ